jgi:histidyl-tRNA synthetase
MAIGSLPGFRDFYPEDLALRRHIFAAWREVAGRYGFVEYDGPPLEALELYTRKSGDEIVGQLYRFEDRGGREVALRPEMTPTFARMVSARAAAMPKPIRWFTIPQLFRYERPQRGRLREHFQLNMDIVGGTGVAADAEVVAAAVDCLRALGLGASDIVARVSDRQLIRGVLLSLGFPEERLLQAFAALDRVDKESEEWVLERLMAAGGDADAAQRVLALAESSLEGISADYGANQEVRESVERLGAFFEHMASYGLGEYVEFDHRLVRGLAYYTGLVFEVWERSGELRAVCGGGRYDNLLASLGGADLPAAGFGMGDVVLGELLKDRGLVPAPPQPVQDFVVIVSPAVRPLALELVRGLREAGRRVSFDLGERAVGKQFKATNQAGAVRAIIVGPDEAARGVVRVREMETGEETETRVEALAPEGLRRGS